MGLSEAIARLAVRRVHILLVEIPGSSMLRMHAESAIIGRGWVLATTPADADALLVCGEPTESFTEPLEGVWNQIPNPRCRTSITTTDAIAGTLDSIPATLTDHQRQRADAQQRPKRVEEDKDNEHDDGSDGHHDHGHMNQDHQDDDRHHEHGQMQHTHDDAEADDDHGMDHDAMEMDHSGMDHSHMHMDMSGPAGIPLAGGDESDRDGLEMDITHLSLGPILPDWPAGLVIRCVLHGDVVGSVDIEFLPGQENPAPSPRLPAESGSLTETQMRSAELCDAAARLLAVAGWEPVTARVRRVRNTIITGSSGEQSIARLQRVSWQVERSRTLRWSLAGISNNVGADVRATLLDWLRTAAVLLSDEPVPSADSSWARSLDDVREALIGQELSVVRLLIASIEPARFGELVGVSHG